MSRSHALSPHILPHVAALPALSPFVLTRLIGRQRERATLTYLLSTTRLLTLVGAGGCGKTRLALALAESSGHLYPQGIALVELAALTDPTYIPYAVAAAMGIYEQPGQPILDTLISAFRPRNALIVLDNCEHLIAACATLVTRLATACPHLTVLATSREALQVAGEVLWQVPPLTLPENLDAPTPSQLLASEAAQLFADRARLRRTDFMVTRENAATVAAICRRLDGMPLALELAAACVGAMPLTEIAARLNDALGLLTAGNRGAMLRQQTLRATLDWSYSLLNAEERAVFRRLAICVGGCTPAAAEAICAGENISGLRVLAQLARLVDKSLVVLDGDGEEARYRLLEVVRQYALERLDKAGERGVVRQRHADYYLALSDAAKRALAGAAIGTWLERLEADLGNFRAALEWSRTEVNTECGLLIAANLWRFWYIRCYLTEGFEWLISFLAAEASAARTEIRLDALFAAGRLAIFRGDYHTANALLEEMLVTARAYGQSLPIASALTLLGHNALEQCLYDQAEALYVEAVAHARISGDHYALALASGSLGIVTIMHGSPARAEAIFEEVLPLYRQLGDTADIARAYRWLGMIAIEQGDIDRARAALTTGLTAQQTLHGHVGVAECLEGFAALAVAEMQPARALTLASAADAIRATIGAPLPAHWRAWLAPRLDSARQTLGTATSETAWARGSAMLMETAIAEAMRAGSPAPAERHGRAGKNSRSLKQWYGGLTARERDVVALTVGDQTNRAIAQALFITEKTVETHIGNALRKLGFGSRTQLAAWAVAVGLVADSHTNSP